ncbi:MAG: putative C-S lyase [Betaproteobacteria bacterium]|nr:putative C-S lyase [Betaproteobacteria bacterium]
MDFDTIIDRRGADSIKWNKYAGRDVIPLWVADMDFAAPPAVLEALQKRVDHGVFGYGEPWPSLVEAVQTHLAEEYSWQIEADWLVWLPGLVTGLNIACRAVGKPNDAVFTFTPVYPPFFSAPQFSQRRAVVAPLTLVDGRWQWDEAAVEAALAVEPDTRLFLLCHPHNPVGRVWREEELRRMAAFAERHDLVVCSDEIHCGLVLDPQLRHRPFAALSPESARRSITLMAPSKTFNIPGLGCAFAVIPDAALRRNFEAAMQGIVPHVNVLGLAATEAAYRHGGAWRTALLDTLRSNRDLLEARVAALPGLTMNHVEATYLAWIDARELCRMRGIENPQRFFEQAGVGLSDGANFTPRGQRDTSGFIRLNFGCPRPLLESALERMRAALT